MVLPIFVNLIMWWISIWIPDTFGPDLAFGSPLLHQKKILIFYSLIGLSIKCHVFSSWSFYTMILSNELFKSFTIKKNNFLNWHFQMNKLFKLSNTWCILNKCMSLSKILSGLLNCIHFIWVLSNHMCNLNYYKLANFSKFSITTKGTHIGITSTKN